MNRIWVKINKLTIRLFQLTLNPKKFMTYEDGL